MIRYLSAEAMLVLHSELVDATGGSHGVRDPGLLASIAEKPQAVFSGTELYPDLFTKAAVYLESLANYRVFIDGNKRASIVVAARFLYENGYDLAVTNREMEKFVLSVAADKTPLEEITVWLSRHAKKIRAARPRGAKKRYHT